MLSGKASKPSYGKRELGESDKTAFPFIRIFYPTDIGRTAFIGVINSDQTIFNVGVSFCADFCSDK